MFRLGSSNNFTFKILRLLGRQFLNVEIKGRLGWSRDTMVLGAGLGKPFKLKSWFSDACTLFGLVSLLSLLGADFSFCFLASVVQYPRSFLFSFSSFSSIRFFFLFLFKDSL